MKKNFDRLFLGFPLPTVAKASNLPRTTVWRHATGNRKISAEAALVYSKALGVPLSQIRPDLWPPNGDPAPAREPAVAGEQR